MSADYPSFRIDSRRSCELPDGHPAAALIRADGSEMLAVICPVALEAGESIVTSTAQLAPHEEPGVLPTAWQRRVRFAPIRCGSITAWGTACRRHVLRGDQACSVHRKSRRKR